MSEFRDLIKKAENYWSMLPPHAKEREGGILFKQLLDALQTADKKAYERAVRECADVACHHSKDFRTSVQRDCCMAAEAILKKIG